MKKYIDIQVVREKETVLDDITLPVNTGAFQVGDIISITEKMDGANASIRRSAIKVWSATVVVLK